MSREGFMELEVWHDAKNLAVNIYKMTIEGELSKDFDLKIKLDALLLVYQAILLKAMKDILIRRQLGFSI